MSKFEKISVVGTITNQDKSIVMNIVKYKKAGTSRIFYRPEHDDKPVSRTMWGRKYEAENQAQQYIAFKKEKADQE